VELGYVGVEQMRVYVKAPARLHLGLIDLGGDLGRLFGGMGVAITQPNAVVEAEKSEGFAVEGEKSELVKPWVELFLKKYDLKPEVAVNVKQTIPQHVGLGSGTQLALATATALAKLFDIKASAQELSKALGRGGVSGVGTALFKHGGFVVEGGVKSQKNKPNPSWDSLPPAIFQSNFPDDWFFAVAIPQVKGGLSGEAEAHAFGSLPPMSAAQAGRISRLILMSLLPALKEKDIATFGAALTQIQNLVGDCFAPAQGGRFSSSPSGECIKYMLENGAVGAGQSSWGPTVYGLVKGKSEAEKLSSGVWGLLEKKTGGQVFWVGANNKGAYVKTTS
jgi:beta-ribofuranosylaminobenzene 5'-phosphate synthase